jgi:hypothetical protein
MSKATTTQPTADVQTAEVSSPTQLTPYAAAKVVNEVLNTEGIDKVVPPQMMYNYTTGRIRAGKKPLIETVEVDGKVFIKADALQAWVVKYVAKQSASVES